MKTICGTFEFSWNDIEKEYIYIAQDKNGGVAVYCEEPYSEDFAWYNKLDSDWEYVNSSFIKKENPNWKNSLLKRQTLEEKLDKILNEN